MSDERYPYGHRETYAYDPERGWIYDVWLTCGGRLRIYSPGQRELWDCS